MEPSNNNNDDVKDHEKSVEKVITIKNDVEMENTSSSTTTILQNNGRDNNNCNNNNNNNNKTKRKRRGKKPRSQRDRKRGKSFMNNNKQSQQQQQEEQEQYQFDICRLGYYPDPQPQQLLDNNNNENSQNNNTLTQQQQPSQFKLVEPTSYIRIIQPYPFTFATFAKARWIGRSVLDVYKDEFGSYPSSYYERAIQEGRILVSDRQVPTTYKIKGPDVLSHTVHRHEPAVAISSYPVLSSSSSNTTTTTTTTDSVTEGSFKSSSTSSSSSSCMISIVDETPDLVVADKPGTLPVHPCGGYHINSLVRILQPQYGKLYTINRLDRLTSGLVLLAKSSKIAQVWGKCLMERGEGCEKLYIARVKGRFPLNVDPSQKEDTKKTNGSLKRQQLYQTSYNLSEGDDHRHHYHHHRVCRNGEWVDQSLEPSINSQKEDTRNHNTGTQSGGGISSSSSNRDQHAFGYWIVNSSKTDNVCNNDSVTAPSLQDVFDSQHPVDIWLQSLDGPLPSTQSSPTTTNDTEVPVNNEKDNNYQSPSIATAKAQEHHQMSKSPTDSKTTTLPPTTTTTTTTTTSTSTTKLLWLRLACPVRISSPKDGVCEAGSFEDLDDELYDKTVKPAETQFAVIKYDAQTDSTIVLCKPTTGRTHQIRLHLQILGHPIANDPNYGGTLFYADPDAKVASVHARKQLDRMDLHHPTASPSPTNIHVSQKDSPLLTLQSKNDNQGTKPSLDASPLPSDDNNNNNNDRNHKEDDRVGHNDVKDRECAHVRPPQDSTTTDTPATEEEINACLFQSREDGESLEDFIKKTCVWCARSRGFGNDRTVLEYLTRSRGIWLHAFRYNMKSKDGTRIKFQTQLPSWSSL